MNLSKASRASLLSGVVVANFCSGHPFHFEDETILDACTSDRVGGLSCMPQDSEATSKLHEGLTDVLKGFILTDDILEALQELENDDTIHVVIVPFPLLSTIKSSGIPLGKVRTILSVKRAKDGNPTIVSASKFCC